MISRISRRSLLCLSAVAALVALGDLQNCAAAENAVANLSAGNRAFAFDVYAQLKSANGNLFLSPYSISTCLAMTYSGARGSTAAQMAGALHFDTDPQKLAASFSEMQNQLDAEKKSGIELNVANGMWAQAHLPFLAPFANMVRNSYGANLQQIDFRKDPKSALAEINRWVSDKTQGKINDLIQPGALDPTTRLLLVNAIYFKGQWAKAFDKRDTASAPFFISSTQTNAASLMEQTADFRYADLDGVQFLEMPYLGDNFSLIVLLPRAIDGLTKVEASVNEKALGRWQAQARERKVHVFLPQFKFSSQFNLSKNLIQLGMPAAFSAGANFSGIDGARDLFISAVIHKAFVDVSEEGTEAAAATGSGMRTRATRWQGPIPTFRADHPFVFLIRDTRSDVVLFIGRIVDPTVN